MGKNTENTFYVIISLQVVGFSQNWVGMFFSMIPMQCSSQNSKFEKFGHFIGGSDPPVSIGGVLDRTFGPSVTDDKGGEVEFVLSIVRVKKKYAHIQKDF